MKRTDERGPVETFEDAVHLLREAGLRTLGMHWVGSVPMAMGALAFRNVVANPRVSNAELMAWGLGLAALLVWMNCWRAAFARELRGRLGAARGMSRIWSTIAAQAFLGATRLLVVPLAAMILFPLPKVVGFYRYAAALEEADPAELMRRARRAATTDWPLLLLLVFFFAIVFLNAATAIFLLPQLVKILTGYESVFSRSGSLILQDGLFWLLTLAASWLAFDPLAQAVYCVAGFREESRETGEDIRAGLRRLRAAALLVLLVAPLSAQAVRAPELRQSIERTMQAHEYDWRLPAAQDAPHDPSWLVQFTDRMMQKVKAFFRWVGNALDKFFRWLGEKLRVSGPEGLGGAPGRGLAPGMWTAIVAAVLALALLAWRAPWARLRRKKAGAAPTLTAVRLDAPELLASDLPEERWNELADEALRQGDTRLALRALYLANLAWLGRLEFLAIHAGKTNREYEAELRRRTRSVPEARRRFAENLLAFERAWYGLHEVSEDGIAEFRERTASMKVMLAAVRGVAA